MTLVIKETFVLLYFVGVLATWLLSLSLAGAQHYGLLQFLASQVRLVNT